MVTFDPASLGSGATGLSRSAEAMRRDTASVERLHALREAFDGAGQQAWPAVEAMLNTLRSQVEAAGNDTLRASDDLRMTADGATMIDHDNSRSLGG